MSLKDSFTAAFVLIRVALRVTADLMVLKLILFFLHR